MSLASRIDEVIESTDSLLCVGLDPASATTPALAERECLELLEQTLPYVCAVKPNIAFFERFGSRGIAVLERVLSHVPNDRILILDAKRGDIGTTADAYAAAAFVHFNADAVTVNPLMGKDAVVPFLQKPDRGAFVLTRTSNPGAEDFLRLKLLQGDRLFERIVESALTWDATGAVGFVVGATDVSAIRSVRHLAPNSPLLVPGLGAQGGDLDAALLAALDVSGRACVFPLSRGISQAASPANAARKLRDKLNTIRRVHRSAVVRK